MPDLHSELAGESKGGACKVCTFLHRLDPSARAEWEQEIALPLSEISHAAIVIAMKRRMVPIEEASVRRHRSNHVGR